MLWREILHRDDASEEEKKDMVEEMKNSPPISPMHAFLHPFVVVRAHKALKRYQGKTWIQPRLMWLFLLAVSAVFVKTYFDSEMPGPSPIDELLYVLFGAFVLPLSLILASHLFTTAIFRTEEACVWCHIIQRNMGGSVESVLTISAYRLPFLDPSRKNTAPWQREWWNTIGASTTLETKKDVSRLNLADIYDENVCRVRPPALIPPTARRYVIGRVERYGDVAVRERRKLSLKVGTLFQTIIITAIGVAISATVTLLTARCRRVIDKPAQGGFLWGFAIQAALG